MARAAGQKSTPVSFDFSKVEAADGVMPKRLQKSKVDDTPFPAWYEESWTSGYAKVLTLPTEAAAEEAQKLAGTAARRFGIANDYKSGIRHHVKLDEDGNYVYTFLAVDRTKPGEEDVEEPADEVDGEDA